MLKIVDNPTTVLYALYIRNEVRKMKFFIIKVLGLHGKRHIIREEAKVEELKRMGV